MPSAIAADLSQADVFVSVFALIIIAALAAMKMMYTSRAIQRM